MEQPEQYPSPSPNLIAVSWQMGDDARLIRTTIAARDEDLGRVFERVLMEAFVLGHLREVDAFLDPGALRSRWQILVRRNGHEESLRLNQSFAQQQLHDGDRLLLHPLPQHAAADGMIEDLLQQKARTRPPIWLALLLLLLLGGATAFGLWWFKPSLFSSTPRNTPPPPLSRASDPPEQRTPAGSVPDAGTLTPTEMTPDAGSPSLVTEPNADAGINAEADPTEKTADADEPTTPAPQKAPDDEEAPPTPRKKKTAPRLDDSQDTPPKQPKKRKFFKKKIKTKTDNKENTGATKPKKRRFLKKKTKTNDKENTDSTKPKKRRFFKKKNAPRPTERPAPRQENP